jgi:hypothetical protein
MPFSAARSTSVSRSVIGLEPASSTAATRSGSMTTFVSSDAAGSVSEGIGGRVLDDESTHVHLQRQQQIARLAQSG